MLNLTEEQKIRNFMADVTMCKAVKYVLREAASRIAANSVIAYNMTDNYPSTRAAEGLINVNWDRVNTLMRRLKDYNPKRFIKKA